MDELTAVAKEALAKGNIELRVRRQGMYQRVEFKVVRNRAGAQQFVVLSSDRYVDAAELSRLADEVGLPIFAANGKIFPKNKGITDFIGL